MGNSEVGHNALGTQHACRIFQIYGVGGLDTGFFENQSFLQTSRYNQMYINRNHQNPQQQGGRLI